MLNLFDMIIACIVYAPFLVTFVLMPRVIYAMIRGRGIPITRYQKEMEENEIARAIESEQQRKESHINSIKSVLALYRGDKKKDPERARHCLYQYCTQMYGSSILPGTSWDVLTDEPDQLEIDFTGY